MLVAAGILDDLMDAVTWFPGVSALFATMSATIQIIAIMLDSNLRKQAASDKAKLLLKRWLLIATASLIEGALPVINLLPLQTLAGWAVRYIRKKT